MTGAKAKRTAEVAAAYANAIYFEAPGPMSAAFLSDRSFISGIMGPIGSAKTSTCLVKGLHVGLEQAPSPDGWRRTRGVVVRDTYRNMHRTTLPTWFKRVPRGFGKFNDGGGNGPSAHTLRFQDPMRGKIEIEILFAAIGDHDVEDFCRGFEVTWAYVNEADRLAPEVFQYLPDRTGRFPEKDEPRGFAGPTWRGVWCDFNAPDYENHLVDRFFAEEPLPNHAIFVQPGGRDPGAENVQNLPDGYYDTEGKADWYVHRMIDNKFGYSREGMPVYPEYNDRFHCAAEPLEPLRGLPIHFGFDAGMTPAMVAGQRLPNGQRRYLDEIATTAGAGMGPDRFARLVNELIARRYGGREGGLKIGHGTADPSAAFGADREADEHDWIQSVANKTKIRIRPAPTNNLTPRLDAVRTRLTRMIDGRTPAILISPTMVAIRRGFNSGYRYKRIRMAGAEHRYADQPEKNDASHPHDALQYDCLDGEFAEVMGRAKDQAVDLTPASDEEFL